MTFTSTIYATKEEWLRARMDGIGGSDAPIITGANPWSSPYELACRKRGLIPDQEETERMQWGRLLEPLAFERLRQESGLEVHAAHPFEIWRCGYSDCDHMIATLDAVARVPGTDSCGVVEVKSTGLIPDKILLDPNSDVRKMWDTQLLHDMKCFHDVEWGILAAVLGGQRFRWYRLGYDTDPSLVNRVIDDIKKTREFWEMLQRGDLPEPDDSEASSRAVFQRHPKDDGRATALDHTAVELLEQWEKAKADIADAIARERLAKNRLAARIGNNTFGVLPNGVRLSYRTVERKGYTVEATSFRELKRVGIGRRR